MLTETCSINWLNADRPQFKGPHTCHLEPGHESTAHECACGSQHLDAHTLALSSAVADQ